MARHSQYIHEPKRLWNRTNAQKSIFVRPPTGYVEPDGVVEIPQELKVPILDYLNRAHSISSETLYNDLHGYIRRTEIHREANERIHQALFHQTRRELCEALECCNDAISLNPNAVNAYGIRGSVYHASGDPERAILDYNQVIAFCARASRGVCAAGRRLFGD